MCDLNLSKNGDRLFASSIYDVEIFAKIKNYDKMIDLLKEDFFNNLMEFVMTVGNFEFKGNGLSFLWLLIWTTVVTAITWGLFFPWAYSAQMRWIASNTFVTGKKLVFKGSGLGFFGTYLLIIILTIITVGIYTPWGVCRFIKWTTENMDFAE